MSLAVESLLLKRQQLLDEQSKMNEKFDGEIIELDTAIKMLTGEKVTEVVKDYRFDDTNPDYIRASIED